MTSATRTWRELIRPSVRFTGSVQITTGLLLLVALFVPASWEWWLLAGFGYFLYAGVGLSVGFHRYYAHRAFEAPRWAQLLFIWLGSVGCSGSPASWLMMHRQHHAFADRPGDPHSPADNGWRVVMIHRYGPRNTGMRLRREFRRDRFHLWVHRYYVPVVLGYAAILTAIDWRLGLFGWAVPVAIKLWMSGLSVYVAHARGYRNFQTPDDSYNVWWLGYLAFGEGWHNNHHARPRSWDFSHRAWEFDLGAWTVRAILAIDRLVVALRAGLSRQASTT